MDTILWKVEVECFGKSKIIVGREEHDQREDRCQEPDFCDTEIIGEEDLDRISKRCREHRHYGDKDTFLEKIFGFAHSQLKGEIVSTNVIAKDPPISKSNHSFLESIYESVIMCRDHESLAREMQILQDRHDIERIGRV